MKKNKKNINVNSIINLCKLSKQTLRSNLIKYLCNKKKYKNIKFTDNYIIAEGTLPICLIAHMDTVFKHKPEEFIYDQKKRILWSPGGSGFDDRVGIYLILQIINAGYYPSIIFTDLEEIGGIGSKNLIEDYPKCPFKDCRALIQLDRAYDSEAVFYNCDNPDFTEYICKYGFKEEIGTFSDISIIAPEWEIAAVNLSVGYVDEHFATERLYIDWMENTYYKICHILQECQSIKTYKYIPYKDNNEFYFNWKETCAICFKTLGKTFYEDKQCECRICEQCYKIYYLEESIEQAG